MTAATERSGSDDVGRRRPSLGQVIAERWPAWGSVFIGYFVLLIIYFPILWLMILSISSEPPKRCRPAWIAASNTGLLCRR